MAPTTHPIGAKMAPPTATSSPDLSPIQREITMDPIHAITAHIDATNTVLRWGPAIAAAAPAPIPVRSPGCHGAPWSVCIAATPIADPMVPPITALRARGPRVIRDGGSEGAMGGVGGGSPATATPA